jgi:hypothetical protein
MAEANLPAAGLALPSLSLREPIPGLVVTTWTATGAAQQAVTKILFAFRFGRESPRSGHGWPFAAALLGLAQTRQGFRVSSFVAHTVACDLLQRVGSAGPREGEIVAGHWLTVIE